MNSDYAPDPGYADIRWILLNRSETGVVAPDLNFLLIEEQPIDCLTGMTRKHENQITIFVLIAEGIVEDQNAAHASAPVGRIPTSDGISLGCREPLQRSFG